MASWKKLIVSGSDAVLSTVTVDTVVCGNLCGEADTAVTATTALKSCIIDTDTTGTRYLTFVSDEGNSEQLNIDKTTLSYAADTNLLAIGSDSSAPGAICFIAGTGGGPAATTLQTQPLAADTIVCFPDTSGVIIVDQGVQTISGNKTFSGENSFTGVTDFTSTVCLGNATSDIIQATGSVSISGSLAVDGPIVGSISCATTVRAQSTTEDVAHEMPFINYTANGQYGLCVRSTVTFNPNSNELRTFGICGCSYICGGNVRGNYICSVGAVCSATITTSGNATIGGDLTVNGTTTYLNTANLAVEDRFVLLNSGSNTPREAGLVVDEGAPSGSGHAFVYDNNTARWGFTSSLDSTATSVAPDAFAAAVVTQETCGVAEYKKTGNIFVCTNTQDIYIWS